MGSPGDRNGLPVWPVTRGRALLGFQNVTTAVLRPALFVGVGAEGLFFPKAGGANTIGAYAQFGDLGLNGVGAILTEREIVFDGAALVAMPFDHQLRAGMVGEELRARSDSVAAFGI